MGGKRFRTGSILVLFTVTILCVAIFAALTVSAAQTRKQTARRFADHIALETACENQGQCWLAQAEAYRRGAGSLPENTTQTGSILETTISLDGVELTIQVYLGEEACEIRQWSCITTWQSGQSWNLWEG